VRSAREIVYRARFLDDERESSRHGQTVASETRVVEAMRDNEQESRDVV
jgi:hypothetical protein